MECIEPGAPVMYLSNSARPKVIELSIVTSWRLGRVHTSIGQSFMVLGSPTVSFGKGAITVWPDGTWASEAATTFVSHLCESGLCDTEAAHALLSRHGLWWNPFTVVDWRDSAGAAGGLRVVLTGKDRPPRCSVLGAEGVEVCTIDSFRHDGRLAG